MRAPADSIVLFFCSLLFGCSFAKLGCIGSKRKPVDWFSAYKIPRIEESEDKLIQGGVAHTYLDTVHQSWTLSGVSVNDTNQAIGFTLDQIYSGSNNNVTYLMYNDEEPDGAKHFTRGHLKGVVAFDDNQGFWLVHSTPKFPPSKTEGYAYPHSGHTYGQTFLCITLDGPQLNTIAKQLLISWPAVYDYNIPKTSRYASDQDLQLLVSGKHSHDVNNTAKLSTSLEGQVFVSFAKSRNFKKDLYSAWVAPYFKSDLCTETWQNGRGSMDSECDKTFKVENIRDLSLPPSISFRETKDHAKWAVTSTDGLYWICIGDINRQYSQEERGGGTVCTNHKGLWTAYYNAIVDVEKCPEHTCSRRCVTCPSRICS